MTTTITYELNGQHLDGWDENDHDTIDLDLAASNLTDWQPGDVLTAQLIRDGEVIDEQSKTL